MILIFPAIPWSFYTQRPQHLARELAKEGQVIFYVSPTNDESKFNENSRARVNVLMENVFELLLLVDDKIDIHQGILSESTAEKIAEIIQIQYPNHNPTLLLQHPCWIKVSEALLKKKEHTLIYDCMDDIESFPDAPVEVLKHLELKTVEQADSIIVTSNALKNKFPSQQNKVHIIPNAAEFNHFKIRNKEKPLSTPPPHKPIVGYVGSLRSWFDAELILNILNEIEDCTIHLIGKVEDISKISHQRLYFAGERDYNSLPATMSKFDVCIIPFHINELTLATDPVKLYEYFSQGKPVVSTALPEVSRFNELVYIAESSKDFVEQTKKALSEPLDSPLREERIKVAMKNSWNQRALDIIPLLPKNAGAEELKALSLLFSQSFLKEKKEQTDRLSHELAERDAHWKKEIGKICRSHGH